MRIGGVDLLRTLSRFALVVGVGGVASACGPDTTRFASNPFSNPFESSARNKAEPTMTGAIDAPAAPAAPMRGAAVESRPLAPPPASPATPIYNRPAAPPAPLAAPTHSPAPPTASGPAGWTAQGGTRVTLRAGDNLNAVATRYGVPPAAILSANGLSSAAQLAPGRQIVIPVYHAGGASPAAAAPSRPAAVAAKPAAEPKLRFVPGAQAKEAKAEKPGSAKARISQSAKQPAKPEPKLAKAEPPKPAPLAKAEPAKPAKPEKTAALAPPKPAEAPKPAQSEIAKTPAKEPEATASIAAPAAPAPSAASGLGFRWPAKGRVIAGFGGAGGNEGINIALPEGTPVKAAEDGTVAYAGSDVKGYGKLVLIRHDNGYVSAYAHNGEINVKHGEKVKRGQPIAKSGQTGNVTAPQLHFEIRKGATPIDPMPHLSGS